MLERRAELKRFAWLAVALVAAWFLPVGSARFEQAVLASLGLLRAYAREHVVLCLVPALWIAGAIAVFVSQASVLRYLGPKAPPVGAYAVASVSGTILAVCSCTVLPLFAGIYRIGAGLGPAATFLYAGPAINVLAIILTARVLGLELGAARAVGAVVFSVAIGLLMHLLFRREESSRAQASALLPDAAPGRPLGQTAVLFGALIGVLVFANWGGGASGGFFAAVYAIKWWMTGAFAALLGLVLWRWMGLSGPWLLSTGAGVAVAAVVAPMRPEVSFLVATAGLAAMTAGREGEPGEWFEQTWGYAKLILPLLLAGVLLAGLLMGSPGHEGWLPEAWVANAVGGEGLRANFVAALAGALMYFATLTEVPILEGLLRQGMGRGPALALLLAGPAVSLPSILVLTSILGVRKSLTFAALVVLLSTLVGWCYGLFA